MEKTIILELNIETAKIVLNVAGFNTKDKTDDEIFDMVLDRIVPYGAKYSEIKGDKK